MYASMPFIVGAPRSGTTLLRLMLDANPILAIPPETGFFVAAIPEIRSPGDFLGLLMGAETWPDFAIEPGVLLKNLCELSTFSISDGYRIFYATYAARFDKPRYGDKTPIHIFHMQRIELTLPEAHFIHIIRDGRDAALSLREQWFSPGKNMATLAKFWMDHVNAGRAAALQVRKYLEVRFEDLILDPAAVLARICDFIEIDFTPSMLTYYERAPARLQEHQGRAFADGSVLSKASRYDQQKRATLPPQQDQVFRWRHSMRSADIKEFQAVAGSLLADLHYTIV
jgi:hypothetical protein